MKKSIALLAIAALALAACGGAEVSPSASADTGAIPGAGGGSTVIAPLILNAETLSGDLIVGQTATFDLTNPGDWTISTDQPALVNLTAGGDQNGYMSLPAATALVAGTVAVTLENATSGETLVFTLTIK